MAFVRIALPLDQVENRLESIRRVVWTAAGLTAAAATLLAFLFARRTARPLQDLTHGAERISAGNYGFKVYAIGQDEVGTLARAFNNMSTRLAEQFTQLEEDRQQLRTVLSGMVEGVLALDAEQRILFANDLAGQLLGFRAEPAVGRPALGSDSTATRSRMSSASAETTPEPSLGRGLDWKRARRPASLPCTPRR